MNFVSFNNIEIAFETICPAEVVDESTTIIFLHEALGSIPQWKDFPSVLCQAVQLNGIVYERQGHGSSSPIHAPRDNKYLHHYAYDELHEFLKRVVPSKRILLVGHSDGGSIALLYAARFPENVLGVVTLAAHVINEPETRAGIPPAIKAFENGKLNGLFKYHGDKTEILFDAWSNTWLSESFREWNICKEIEAVVCPVLSMQGIRDQYGSEKQLHLIAEHVRSDVQTDLILSAGHHPHLENQEHTLSKIITFISFKLGFSRTNDAFSSYVK